MSAHTPSNVRGLLIFAIICTALACFAMSVASAEQPRTVADAPATVIDPHSVPFYEELARHGTWAVTQTHGTVWIPREASRPTFRPYYSRGYWLATNHGFVFASTYPWGRYAYHYGRWTYLPDQATWAWIPGVRWGASWVSWKWNDVAVSWAPLGPLGSENEAYRVFVPAHALTLPNFETMMLARDTLDERTFAQDANVRVWPRGPNRWHVRARHAVSIVPGRTMRVRLVAPPVAPRAESRYARTRRIALAAPGASFAPPPAPPPPVARVVVVNDRRRSQHH